MSPSDVLSVWAVYEKPKDYPCNWVARRHEVRGGVSTPTLDVIVSLSLADVRGCLLAEEPGLVCLQRHPDDDPVIIETWI